MTGIDITQQIESEDRDIVRFLRNLMIEHSLPLWSGEGWDSAAGGFVEKLDIEGSHGESGSKHGRSILLPKPLRWAGIQKAAKSQ
jgi:hypothetical protein